MNAVGPVAEIMRDITAREVFAEVATYGGQPVDAILNSDSPESIGRVIVAVRLLMAQRRAATQRGLQREALPTTQEAVGLLYAAVLTNLIQKGHP